MSNRRTLISAALAAPLAGLAPAGAVLAGELKKLRRPARAILVTGGGYARYQELLTHFVQGLKTIGLVADASIPGEFDGDSTQPVWAWYARYAGGKSIEFLADGHYSYEWSDTRRDKLRWEIIDRVNKKRDVDIIFTLGTHAGVDMASRIDEVPVVSLGSTDPVMGGIIHSAEDSGKDNVHAVVFGDFFGWQIRRFHAIFRFKHLGILMGQDLLERSGVGDARKIGKELGFDVMPLAYDNTTGHSLQSVQNLKKGLRELIDHQMDALYIPYFYCPDDDFPELLSMLTSRGIPAFTQEGTEPVKRGILLGSGEGGLTGYGVFEAQVVQRILAGEKPRSIPQVYTQGQNLVINLKTAMQMGWDPPLGLIVTTEAAYTTQSPARQKIY